MSVSVDVQEIGEFAVLDERYAPDWRRIAAASPAATVFQTWEWTAAWWRHHGAGRSLRALVFTDAGMVVGFAALVEPGLPTPLRTWRFAGTGGSDYLDLLAEPGREQAVCDAFLAYLKANARRWDWLDLQQVRPGAAAEGLTGATTGGAAVRVAAWEGETCPYLPLADDWEAVRKAFGKKLRQNIGYYARALEKVYAVEYRLATADTLADDLTDFFDLHQKRWNQRWLPGAFASRRARAFHEDAARSLLEAGMLRLHTLSLDGEVQAALYCFQKGERCYYYLGGFEPTLARWSIGTLLTAHAIRHAVEADGAREFDFLRGDEGYKYRWGAKDRFNRRLSVTHPGVRPALLAAAGRASLRAEQRFKTWMHARHGGGAGTKVKGDG
jgi:CelD/BcsL family acetyltransferase involved in cellulose biosynthesis